MKATSKRDRAHARIYCHWLQLDAYRCLSCQARALLVEILAEYRPGTNGMLSWPVRKAAAVLGVSKSTAASCLIQLERNGWVKVTRISAFGGRASPAQYRLTMFVCDVTCEPPTDAFAFLPGESFAKRRPAAGSRQKGSIDPVFPDGRDGLTGGTTQSNPRDKVRIH